MARQSVSGGAIIEPIMRIAAVVPALLCFVLGAGGPGQAFDCSKAATAVEKRICRDGDLKALDDRLDRFYAAAMDVMQQSACLRNDERVWLSNVRNRCTTPACLRDAYLKRLGTLAGLQPGMNLPKGGDDLPAVPRLRLFIPPAGRLEANIVRSGTRYEARGLIGYVLDNGGFVLIADDGSVHALISDMAINPDTYVALGVLKDQHAKVIVIGQHGRLDGSTLAFDNRSCIAVYEQP